MTEIMGIDDPPELNERASQRDYVRNLYTPRLEAARMRFATNPTLLKILHPQIDEAVLELFLIFFNALGVRMTRPVEDWIRRAGERCTEIGLGELGRALCAHAKQEAGHHLMMIEDTRRLVARWNARRTPALDADRVLAQPMTNGVRMYCELHEEVIASESPFSQLAIEYEIERLSVTFGPQLFEQFNRRLDHTISSSLSFLEEHVRIDVGHTQFNERQLEKLLTANPSFARPLAHAGGRALDAYAAFLDDCFQLATTRGGEA